MKIEKNKVVALSYELEVEGKTVDKAGEDKPLDYIHGTGMLLPRFEQEVDGKEPGDSFEFTLDAGEGYGEYNPKYKFDIPKESFAGEDGAIREDLLQVGFIIPMVNSSGQVVQGRVAAIGEQTVTMDFNHPMAGKTLHFTGKVISVRDATGKELEQGLHGEFLPEEECSCGCGHHHSDCGCHSEEGCHHGEGHKDGECCHHGEGHEDGECCHHGEGHQGGCCHHHE
ncbi:MAG: peptidylprolyl isomerase [Bacteroidales bacterium]|nr:peptidylprolyl isomerase [Bacteroidales bacterium]